MYNSWKGLYNPFVHLAEDNTYSPGVLLASEEKKCIIYTVITIKRQIAKFNLINPGPY